MCRETGKVIPILKLTLQAKFTNRLVGKKNSKKKAEEGGGRQRNRNAKGRQKKAEKGGEREVKEDLIKK